MVAGLEPFEGFLTRMSGARFGVAVSAETNQLSFSMWPLYTVILGFFTAWSLREVRLGAWWLAVSTASVPRTMGGS